MADLLNILQELRQEREQLDRAIAALEGVSGNGLRPKRYAEDTAQDVGCGSEQDCGGAAGTLGEGEAAEQAHKETTEDDEGQEHVKRRTQEDCRSPESKMGKAEGDSWLQEKIGLGDAVCRELSFPATA